MNGVVPTIQDGVVKNWITVLEEVERVEADVFVPGHGPLMNHSQVKSLHSAIRHFTLGCRRATEMT